MHRERVQAWRDEIHHRENHDNDHRGHSGRLENPSLKEDMKKERMVITVSQDLALPSDIRAKENKELQAIGSHSKVDSKERDEAEDENDDSCDSDHGKKGKVKSPKKKKKKKNKKKKEKKSKS